MEKLGTYKLKGKVMHYDWGGYDYLPQLLHINNVAHKPFAEYWMGAHPLAPSELETRDGNLSLYSVTHDDPDLALSERVANRFGELPYLFKILDVKDILSIQVHPSKKEAEIGYDREEAEGIPISAPYRNYKDRNHKPEVMVALSEFWLLHGFTSLETIERILEEVPEFTVLLPLFRKEGLPALYRFVMEMQQPEINSMLTNLVKRELRRMNDGELSREMPGWWVAKLFRNKEIFGDIDRAIFSIYFFNIVKVDPGQAVFQNAGIPHAYMEGQCVELMANSDNVLRAGLTTKHIDVPELMKHISFESIVPDVMPGNEVLPGEKIYPCPVPDFGIAQVNLSPSVSYEQTAGSLEICIVTEGGALVDNSLTLKRGEAMVIFPGNRYTIQSSGQCTLFRAFVPAG